MSATAKQELPSVQFTTRLPAGGFKEILVRDQARAKKLLAGASPHGPNAHAKHKHHHTHHGHHAHHAENGSAASAPAQPTAGGAPSTAPGAGTGAGTGGSVDATDAGVTYTLSVGVGSPATQYTLLIDTGSSNTWVGAGAKYVPTSTSQSTGDKVTVSYGSGSFSGTEYTDTVTLAPALVITNQSIGVAATATGFSDVDGILGIGPVDLTSSTVAGVSAVPTVTDNLFAQSTIPADLIGISYVPTPSTTSTTAAAAANGELDFGGTDPAKFTGSIAYTPISSTAPASGYWGIEQSVAYGATSILASTSGIVDTGTTLLLLATSAFTAYTKATGGVEDKTTGLLVITDAQYAALEPLVFTVGAATYSLAPNAQIWPRALNATLGGDAGKIYLVVADLGSEVGQGLDFIDGFAFLQRFYSVFDTGNKQVGLATTQYTDATTN
ncbi:acid protease [Athelia psychrophila]|uniref:Acid protease n=1 Tax=Athelia psychrophila TaxID=1759441 RepID=A0A166UDA0_9AGAM|nr:acid protease [Fibularhizoctonia sp. CBS 109695]